uniref:Uncharacterized protein n=1 Tax=Ascaris lumbricoides TaxID=6252 RepID=A0A0M3IXX2_ASCLU
MMHHYNSYMNTMNSRPPFVVIVEVRTQCARIQQCREAMLTNQPMRLSVGTPSFAYHNRSTAKHPRKIARRALQSTTVVESESTIKYAGKLGEWKAFGL